MELLIGSPVQADLVKLRVRVKNSSDNFVSALCAVCEGVKDDLILTNDVVDRLTKSDEYNYCIGGTNNTVVDREADVDKNNASDKNMTTVVRAGRRAVRVGSTCTDQVTRGRPHACPIDTETLTREPFKDGSLHNTHWTPTNHGDGEFDGISHTEGDTFPHSCLPNRKEFEAWHMLHDSGGGHLTSEDAKVPNSVYLSGQSNLASSTRKFYRMDVGGSFSPLSFSRIFFRRTSPDS